MLSLKQVDWKVILEGEDINTMSTKFEDQFIAILDKHAPLRERKVKKLLRSLYRSRTTTQNVYT